MLDFKKGNWLKDRRDGSSTLQRASGKNTAEMDVMKGQCQRLPRWILWRASARDCRDGRYEGPVPETAEMDVMKGQCQRLPRWTLWRASARDCRDERYEGPVPQTAEMDVMKAGRWTKAQWRQWPGMAGAAGWTPVWASGFGWQDLGRKLALLTRPVGSWNTQTALLKFCIGTQKEVTLH